MGGRPGITRRDMLFGLMKRLRNPAGGTDAANPAAVPAGVEPDVLKADAALRAGDFDAAGTHYRAHLAKAPGNDAARARLGYCLYRQARYLQAMVEFTRVLRRAKDNFSSLYLGLCQLYLKKPERALSAWETFLDPSDVLLTREVNFQKALLTSDSPPPPEEAAAAVEQVLAKSGAPKLPPV